VIVRGPYNDDSLITPSGAQQMQKNIARALRGCEHRAKIFP
jgi:hypothetical protein